MTETWGGWRGLVGLGLFLLGAGGCATSEQPLLPDDVATALARTPMRRLETASLRIYYPESRREQAYRFAGGVEACALALKAFSQVHNLIADRRMTLILPELTFNNAFAAPPFAGYQPVAVVPTYGTLDTFSLELGLPQDPVPIACHELTHYVQFQQIGGLGLVLNVLFGETYSPQIGLDSWFFEGLAVYYETRLRPGVGRLAWPYWHGVFAAGVAGRQLNGGDLSALNRDFERGHQYLVGSQFVRFLAERYGQWRLWKLIDVQARAIFFPLWVNVRFWQAYDKSLSTLIDEFAADVAARHPLVERPADQRVISTAGTNARYARAVDGTEALLLADHDTPPRLIVRGPGGDVRLSLNLIDLLPPRRLKIGAPQLTGPLSFTADGSALYFTALDLDATFQASRLVRVDLATAALTIICPDLRGAGGSISPDGRVYAFARADGDRHDLALLDIATGVIRVLVKAAAGYFISLPRYSPDGKRIVATVADGRGFRIVVFDAASGATLTTLTDGRNPVHDGSWADNDRVVYLSAAVGDRGFQVHLADLRTGRSRPVTRAPYLAFQPQVARGTLRFLNREGWRWTLDEVSLPPPSVLNPDPAPVAAFPQAPHATAAIDEALLVLSDQPYHATDHLFVPLLHGPTFTATGRQAFALGLVLAGNDRLQFHRWTLTGTYQFASARPGYGVGFGYANRLLAPYTLTLTGMFLSLHDVPPQPVNAPVPRPQDYTLDKRQRQANVDMTRSFYGNPVTLGFNLTEDNQPGEPTVAVESRRVAGPYLHTSYTAAESTAYAGARRLLYAAADAFVYPATWSSAGSTLTDLRGEITAVTPLPFSRRHRLLLSVSGRAVTGLQNGMRWLQVGGGGVTTLYTRRSPDGPPVPEVVADPLPPNVRFFEPLWGYEDYPIATDRIVIANAAYRYPFIIDWGSASALGLLPSFFLRQVNLAFFGVVASDGQATRHAAAGGSLSLNFAIAELPVSIAYQLARRFEDDRAFVHLVRISGN